MLSDQGLSIGEMLKLRETIGTKKFDQITSASQPDGPGKKKKKEFKRSSKQHPREMTSKRKVSVLRSTGTAVVAEENASSSARRGLTRDPRFDGLSGEFDEGKFHSSYGFLSEMRGEERVKLKEELKKCKDPAEREKLVKVINRLNTSEQAERVKEERRRLVTENRREAVGAVGAGKKPFFEKKAELRKKELRRKFEELKSEGKVEKYVAKRRKKNLQRDRKTL